MIFERIIFARKSEIMIKFENLLFEVRNGILYLTINRENKLNALNQKTVFELKEAFQIVYDDKAIKGVILTGSGEKAFVAGADISEIAALNELNSRKYAEAGQEVFFMIENCHKPVIAAINGFALGGGCELAMACHMRIASTSSRFGQPEVNLGVIPGFGGTQRMTQLIGKGKAIEYMLTGDMINAEQALNLGLVNYVTDPGSVITKAEEILNKIFAKAPLAVGMVIDSVNAVYNNKTDGYQTEANCFSNCCKTKDFIEGTTAFLEKRKPTFAGE
jgi:enoyl-CoA hydratase